MKDIINGVCPECGRSFRGRSDKKFCSIQCKNNHHNRLASAERFIKHRTLSSLDSNYRILREMLLSDKKTAEISDLCALGYSPEIVTGYRKDSKGHREMRCFDIKYCQSETRIFNLERQETFRRK